MKATTTVTTSSYYGNLLNRPNLDINRNNIDINKPTIEFNRQNIDVNMNAFISPL